MIERILDKPTMIAVVASAEMSCGATAYPIAYFATEPQPSGTLARSWREVTYSHPDGGWSIPNDPWDFDLEPWVARGKICWIEPGDRTMTVRSYRDGPCPYVDLPGTRLDQGIWDDHLSQGPTPDGEELEPFE